MEGGAVEVAAEADDVGLDGGARVAVDGGARADAGHGGIEGLPYPRGDGIDAVCGEEFAGGEQEVGCGEAQFAADLFAGDHLSLDGVGTAEHPCGGGYVALLQGLADFGG